MNAFPLNHRLCTAPLLGATDRFYRHFARHLSRCTMLYTEMVNSKAITNGKYEELLPGNALDHPVALQLGGAEPDHMARAAACGQKWGFDEINMNVGCPSPKGVESRFGAMLMNEPDTVAQCLSAMLKAVDLPVTVKCRLGVRDTYERSVFYNFIDTVAATGCRTFIVHARCADISGHLNTKQNRTLLPLDYEEVYELKRRHPELEIIINGGITTLEEAQEHLKYVDGVMIGRAAYHNLFLLSRADEVIYGQPSRPITRRQVIEELLPYMEEQMQQGLPLTGLVRHLLGFYQGVPRARVWRRFLAENAYRPNATLDVLKQALEAAERPSAAQHYEPAQEENRHS